MKNDISVNTTRNTVLQIAEEAKESARSFLGDCYSNEVQMIDSAPDMSTEQKLAARRKTNLIYGMVALVGLGGLALLRCA